MKTVLTVIAISLCTHICARSATPQQGSVEREIRTAVCEIDAGENSAAEKRLEKILQTDPANVYAQRLLLSALTKQVKFGDKSTENIALARKAIQACQRALTNSQFSSKLKTSIDNYILVLYGQISEQEQTNELLRRVSDSTRPSIERSDIYTILASRSWNCSYEITELPTSKRIIVKDNKPVIAYKMPSDLEQFQTARLCVVRGLEAAENAINLNPNNDSAWSYRFNLLVESAKLAHMEDNPGQELLYNKQIDDAKKEQAKVVALMQKTRDDEWQAEEERKTQRTLSRTSIVKEPDEQDQLTKDLLEYKSEATLENALDEFSFNTELSTLVLPVPIAPDPIVSESGESAIVQEPSPQPTTRACFREVDGEAQLMEKRDWKRYVPAGEDFSIELPDNLCSSGDGYIAASDGVKYSISVTARPSIVSDPTVINSVLNILARTFIGFRSRTWVRGANSFEVRLSKKVYLDNHQGKVYGYALISCEKRKEGVLAVYAGKSHYYTVDISGANESDQRVQRFLKSVTYK